MLQAIRMCLRPIVANGNNTPRLLVSLGCASGTNFTLSIIPLINTSWPLIIPIILQALPISLIT